MKNFIPSFQIGQTVLIRLNNKEEYLSKIEKIEYKNYILSNPFEEHNLPIKKHEKINFFILEDNDVFTFMSIVNDIKFGSLPELHIEKPKKIEHNKRRISIRYPVNILVKYEIEHEPSVQKNSLPCEAVAKDISVGGMLLQAVARIPGPGTIKLYFTLPDYPPFEVNGKLTRIFNSDNETKFAVNFIDLKPQEKENILRYIFHNQKNLNMQDLIF